MPKLSEKAVIGRLTVGFLIDFYDACLREEKSSRVAARLNFTEPALGVKMARNPILREIQAIAKERRINHNNLAKYVFDRLSPEAQEIWDQIQFWGGSNKRNTVVDGMLAGKSVHLRQELFVHALLRTTFDMSEACRIVGVSYTEFENWKLRDAHFKKLIHELHWHKKNFFEKALLDLVEFRNPMAVMFVNRTVNGDRGYNEKLQIEHTGKISVGFGIEDLDLDLDTRKKILEAIRKREQIKKSSGTIVEVKALTNGENGETEEPN